MNRLKVVNIATGVVLLCVTMGSYALGLGRIQGAAWVGKPLDVLVQVQSDPTDDLNADCLAARVLYGEAALDPARVFVTLNPASGLSGAGQNLRIVTTDPVDEPIVTVTLRVGCQQKLSKTFTLFAELPTSVVDPVARPVKPAQRVLAEAVPALVAEPQPAPARKPRSGKSVVEPLSPAASAKVPQTNKPQKTISKSRLKLDPLDLLVELDPVLRATTDLLTLPQEDGTKRTEAAALWRSLNASPEQLMQDEAKARAIERDLKSLHAVTTQNQKGLIDLASRVEQAQAQRYSNWLVYSLLGLCMAVLGALLWLWRRTRVDRESDWLHGHDAQDSLLAEIVQSTPKRRHDATVAMPPHVAAPEPVPLPLTEVDFDLDLDLAEPTTDKNTRPISSKKPSVAARADGHRDFSLSFPHGMRALDSEELVDVREQAEFFMSLGQHDKAIDILTTRVAQFGESSPLVCLALLKIYHALGREKDFEFMRAEFNHWFAGYVPEFAAFGNEGRALEQYPQVMEGIYARWPTPQVLEYLEGWIYRHADVGEGLVFDLQAYLDLLFLHSVAKQIVRRSEASDEGPVSEELRIPRANGVTAGDDPQAYVGPAVLHRVGAHYRGSALGSMKHPPTAPSAPSPTAEKVKTDGDGPHTDFNFVGLR